jgi:pSer/pThr/pTyr-binding forkhead associated (FHA) protein
VRVERHVRLLPVRATGADAAALELKQGDNVLGRAGDLAFPTDPLVSHHHAVLRKTDDGLEVTAISGVSGLFRRIREPALVASGETIFAGEQYLLVRVAADVPCEQPQTDDLPAEVFGTPLPLPKLHLTQLLAGGLPGRVTSTDREHVTVGREGCDLSFPQDRYLSGRHLRLELAADQIRVVDVGSRNGTFVRLVELPVRLRHGDELLAGATLLRVDVG